MPVIFDYTDFRQFLRDYYTEQKKALRCFSYKYFANKAGLANKGFIYNIINGKKRLSRTHVFGLCAAMRFDKKESDYFENMVAFNQAVSPAEREHFFKHMQGTKESGGKQTRVQLVRTDQYEFYSKWYHSVIRSLIGMHKKAEDTRWIAKHLNPHLSVWDVRRSIRLLKRLGLIIKTNDGTHTISNPSISTGHDVQNVALYSFYLQHLHLASEALKKQPGEKRNFGGITMGISRKSYDRICTELHSFMEKMMAIAEEDKNADSAYQLNFQFYPMSNTASKEKKNG
jgi:uncharacterized protein (TIGR02147 family)